jgi:hypothetical protein
VVGNGDGRHAEVLGLLDKGVNLVGPVEETVLGVNVEMDELGRHAAFLIFPASAGERLLILSAPDNEVNPRDGAERYSYRSSL